jgi:hypothetical protein
VELGLAPPKWDCGLSCVFVFVFHIAICHAICYMHHLISSQMSSRISHLASPISYMYISYLLYWQASGCALCVGCWPLATMAICAMHEMHAASGLRPPALEPEQHLLSTTTRCATKSRAGVPLRRCAWYQSESRLVQLDQAPAPELHLI